MTRTSGLAWMLAVAVAVPGPAAAGAAPAVGRSAAHRAPVSVAVLPLAPHDTGLPYQVLPTPAELADLTRRFDAGLRADGGIRLIPPATTERAVRAAGFDQRSVERACVVVRCARRIGAMVHAQAVVYGEVTRALSMIWATDVAAVDVRTGRSLGRLQAGYKGDVETMAVGEQTAAACTARLVKREPPCAYAHGY